MSYQLILEVKNLLWSKDICVKNSIQMEMEVKCNGRQTSKDNVKLLHNKPLDLSLQLNNNGEYSADLKAIYKKQNSDDSGYGEPIDDNNSITKPTGHPPKQMENDPLTGKFLLTY